MKAIIIDGERKSSENLKTLLHDFCQPVQVTAVCHTFASAIESIEEHSPDVVFLDTNIKGLNSFDFLQNLKPINFEIVLATAHSDEAIRAFKFSAIDYLLKPIEVNDLRATVEKVRRAKRLNASVLYDQLLYNLKSSSEFLKLALPSIQGFTFVNTADIIYCEADSNYTTFFLKDATKVIVSQTLKEYDELLTPYRFFRIHHAYLINLDAITHYVKGDGGQVVMSNSVRLDVSKRRKEEFLSLFRR